MLCLNLAGCSNRGSNEKEETVLSVPVEEIVIDDSTRSDKDSITINETFESEVGFSPFSYSCYADDCECSESSAGSCRV